MGVDKIKVGWTDKTGIVGDIPETMMVRGEEDAKFVRGGMAGGGDTVTKGSKGVAMVHGYGAVFQECGGFLFDPAVFGGVRNIDRNLARFGDLSKEVFGMDVGIGWGCNAECRFPYTRIPEELVP